MTELLHLENYSFTYPPQRRPALSHVTLTVPEGAFMVLCGPSGCGKSTLLKLLLRVLNGANRSIGLCLVTHLLNPARRGQKWSFNHGYE